MNPAVPAAVDPANDPTLARQRLAAVAAVASLITHSGRNRLSVVRAALELLQARMEDALDDEQRGAFLAQLDLFLGEFNQGVDLVRCHAGPIETIGAREAATEALELVRARAERAGVRLEAVYQDCNDDVRADRGLLRVALLNLLRNGLEALVDTPAPRLALRLAAAGGRYHLQVEDNGPGVPAELFDRLFRDFVTSRRGATGLGLSLCRDAMTAMGGAITYQSARGAPGAVFRLDLARA